MNRNSTAIGKEWTVKLAETINYEDKGKYIKYDPVTNTWILCVANDHADFVLKHIDKSQGLGTVYAPGQIRRCEYEGVDPTITNGRAYLKVGSEVNRVVEETAGTPPVSMQKIITFIDITAKIIEFVL